MLHDYDLIQKLAYLAYVAQQRGNQQSVSVGAYVVQQSGDQQSVSVRFVIQNKTMIT